MSRSKQSKAWLQEHFSDPFVIQARKEGYRSRAVYKLLEIQQKDKLFQPGMSVIDLGAAPGSWSEVVARWVGKKGTLIAIDKLTMEPLPGVHFIQGDFCEEFTQSAIFEALGRTKVDWVISDMAPNTSGVSVVDKLRMMHLAEITLEFTRIILKPQGGFLVKLFQGQGFQEYLQQLRQSFASVVTRKPKASRSRSSELYLLCRGFKI